MKPYSKASIPIIKRWLKRRRETGGRILGRRSVKSAALKGWLPSHLEKNPDLTLAEHREAFEEAHGAGFDSPRWIGSSCACPAAGRSKGP